MQNNLRHLFWKISEPILTFQRDNNYTNEVTYRGLFILLELRIKYLNDKVVEYLYLDISLFLIRDM